ncbi:hypothetical protein Bhyg_00255 [Pseudolycoriella hygida]|uniref:Methionine--tRNA ligase, mitochondrial n=1 Tax=Pseudolycoriella hygida TaxID=35572 RepID=A0A9Q0S4T9_9DIPT|nr:hypothetical protein Bhyg_00255 [Pseudolycoriella hygida]
MLDVKWIRENKQKFDDLLIKRGIPPMSEQITKLDEEKRQFTEVIQKLQHARNKKSKELGNMPNKSSKEFEEMKRDVEHINEKLEELNSKLNSNQQLNNILETLPNLPEDDVPYGTDESMNTVVSIVGEITEKSFPAKQHFELGENLGMMDFINTVKICGSRFVTLKRDLAKLERALINFMIDTHTSEFEFLELSPPSLVRPVAMYNAGQLPKFAEESFVTVNNYRLIPTGEVPLINMVADTIIPREELPIRYVAYTPCFRSEAGSSGRDTRGMLRMHQFGKVELVTITTAEESKQEHEYIRNAAEAILQKLELPYRVMLLCTGDMGFAAQKTYDLEVWLPGQKLYREISSCSNCGDFQARRMKARYKEFGGSDMTFAHTLNASGLPIGRTIIAILENYQNEDGSITIPDILLNSTVDAILADLQDFGAVKLGIRFEEDESYSDLMFLYHRIIHLNEEYCLVPITNLANALATNQYAVGSDKIEVISQRHAKKFASILSIKEYQEISSAALDGFLQLPVELIATEIFFFVNKKEVTQNFKEQSYILQVSRDSKLTEITELDKIMNLDESTPNQFCKQQISLAIIADDLEKLDKSVAQASKELSKIGVVHAKEGILDEFQEFTRSASNKLRGAIHMAYSSFFGAIGDCFKDLCNCGYDEIEEIWNGKVVRRIKPDPICPPYNKRAGREFDNCLNQFDPPKAGTFFYLQHCAERTSDSTYFSPKIRIRYQTCLPLMACWSETATLQGDGECKVWFTASAFPPAFRICARVAMPEVPAGTGLNQKGTPADPGYTQGIHLNDVGAPENDEQFTTSQGTLQTFNRPKLCAYSDPGIINLCSSAGCQLDPMDWNLYKQPLHKTNKLHPITKVLIFFVEQGQAANLPSLLGKLLELLNAEQIPGLDVLQIIVKAIGKVIDFVGQAFVGLLKQFGTLNNAVDDYKFGCVELPLGPYPPPYCPSLSNTFTSASIYTICSKKTPGNQFSQTSNDACVVSKLRNNPIHNAIRISLDNLVPLCKNNQDDPQSTTKCIKIKPFDSAARLMAQVVHQKTNYLDIIKPCSKSTPIGEICVNTKIPLKCSVNTGADCQDGFRVVYAQRIGDTSTISDYFVDDIPNCGNSNASGKSICQEIWGINTGEFIDVPVIFPRNQDNTDLDLLKETVTLKDDNNIPRTFTASIARTNMSDTTIDPPLSRDSKTICVIESGSLVGCTNRAAEGYVIKTYNCTVDQSKLQELGVRCSSNNNYFTPEFIASLQVIDKGGQIIDSTSTIVAPLSVNTTPTVKKGTTEKLINLAGLDFSSFMAFIPDDRSEYIALPFSDKNSLNPLTRYGEYKDNKLPYDLDTGKSVEDAIYLRGLEYVNGQYIHGGTHGCLQPKNINKCVPGVENNNCVLTKLSETDIVDCTKFHEKAASYPSLRLCRKDEIKKQQNCKKLENIEGNKDLHGGRATNYDPKTQAIRDKTSQELGLCTPYPLPKCAAEESGNATWPETTVGELATGTCKAGFTRHAYTSVISDVIARFMRLSGKEVKFLTGTDEHGQKVEKSAIAKKIEPQIFTDQVSQHFRDLMSSMNISNDDFIRTTETRHKRAVIHLWQQLVESDNIYLGSYNGWYCLRDEAFYNESELVDGLAPTGAKVEWVEEPSYFFRLSNWQNKLLDFYSNNPNFIRPASRYNEVMSFVKSGLHDLSISRSSFTWGIKVPQNDKHVIYVWLDALTNYISALGYPEYLESYNKFWPADVHIVGKDILRFHAVYWPAFLMAAGLPPPKCIMAHGWWTNEGQKISKSIGNVIDPLELIAEFGLDMVRYYLTREHQQLEIFDSTHRELTSYINGTLKNFTISYYLIGTEFQKKIWTLLGNIPYGEVISYKEVASLTGSLSSVRAVANAIGHNNLSIIIPCHRVIGSNGKLTGYAAGLEMKRKLLDLESYRLANGLAMSLVENDLKALGRQHDVKQAIKTIETARAIFCKISFDLIYARTEQTFKAWQNELSNAMQFASGHISLYQLVIEKGTLFYKLFNEGNLTIPETDAAADMYEWTNSYLRNQGYNRYEISNYALPGHECRHNLAYWQYDNYLGIGPGAHSRIYMCNNEPQANLYSIMMYHKPEKWLQTVRNHKVGIQQLKPLSNQEIIEEIRDKICLIGKNGCGKSSLMKIIAGDYELDNGELFHDSAATISYLNQEVKPNLNLTIYDFVANQFSSNNVDSYKIDIILERLQLDKANNLSNCSGGQIRRAHLAKVLVVEPDILLLDEPTNHLDISTIEWLEDFVKSYNGAIICVSHDRAFLSNVTNKIWWLDRGNLRKSDKGFKYFEEWQEIIIEQEEATLKKLNKKLDTENEWLQTGVTARRKRNQKRLAILQNLRETARQHATLLASSKQRVQIEKIEEISKSKFIIELDNIVFHYPKTKIIDNFSFRVKKGEKIGIIGPNGSGKTTFIKLLTKQIAPTSGEVTHGTKLDISYFDQLRCDLNPNHSLQQILCPTGGDQVFLPNKTMHVAGYLKQFMFDPKLLTAKVATLSGGEASRLLLAKILINPGNLLILDEPTNDLDMDSLEILLEILGDYPGTLLIISHDRDFLYRLVTRTLIFSNNRIIDISGSYEDYRQLIYHNEKQWQSRPPKIQNFTSAKQTTISEKQSSKKLSYKDQRLLETIPAEIVKLELQVKNLESILSDNSLFSSNQAKFNQVSQELEDCQKKLDELLTKWVEIGAS